MRLSRKGQPHFLFDEGDETLVSDSLRKTKNDKARRSRDGIVCFASPTIRDHDADRRHNPSLFKRQYQNAFNQMGSNPPPCRLAPSLELPTGQFLYARSGSNPSWITKHTMRLSLARQPHFLFDEGNETYLLPVCRRNPITIRNCPTT